jgi:hypothetical protein
MWRMWGRWRALATAVADLLRVNLTSRIAE